MFSKNVGIHVSNEEEVIAILEALHCFTRNFHGGALIVESDPANVITWVSNQKAFLWKLKFIFNKIWVLSASINVVFHHVL